MADIDQHRSLDLARGLRKALTSLDFAEVVDFGADEGRHPGDPAYPDIAPMARRMPNIDLAVIELDRSGRPVAAANVLLSDRHRDGIVLDVTSNMETSGVSWRRWNTHQWDAGHPGSMAVLDTPYSAEVEFMSPYSGCVHKLMSAFHILRLIDEGRIRSTEAYRYEPNSAGGVYGDAAPAEKTVTEWLDPMITVSDNQAGRAMIKMLHDIDEVGALNREFQDLGLRTLQLKGTNPASGGRWLPGQICMTAMDTARLLLIVNGAPGTLWTAPSGEPVTCDMLSSRSREILKTLLLEQGYNDILSTANWFGGEYPAAGIPNAVPERWIGEDGTVTINTLEYRRDVRPGIATAEVTFAHKTGNTYNAAADVGIVRSLPGRRFRHYIVALFSNLGFRFADVRFARSRTLPAKTPATPQYTEKLAMLGRLIDELMAERQKTPSKK